MSKLLCLGGGLASSDDDGPGDLGNSNTDISYHAEGDIVTSDSELVEWELDIDELAESWSSVDDPVEWEPYVDELAEPWSSVDDPVEWEPYVDELAESYSFVDDPVEWEPEPEL